MNPFAFRLKVNKFSKNSTPEKFFAGSFLQNLRFYFFKIIENFFNFQKSDLFSNFFSVLNLNLKSLHRKKLFLYSQKFQHVLFNKIKKLSFVFLHYDVNFLGFLKKTILISFSFFDFYYKMIFNFKFLTFYIAKSIVLALSNTRGGSKIFSNFFSLKRLKSFGKYVKKPRCFFNKKKFLTKKKLLSFYKKIRFLNKKNLLFFLKNFNFFKKNIKKSLNLFLKKKQNKNLIIKKKKN